MEGHRKVDIFFEDFFKLLWVLDYGLISNNDKLPTGDHFLFWKLEGCDPGKGNILLLN